MEISLEPKLLGEIESRKHYIQTIIVQWGRRNFRPFPWRTNRTPYSVLISELLLKRTTASAANRIFEEFICLYPDLPKLSQADNRQLEKLLSKIGYHKRRAKILVVISSFLIRRYNGEIPRTKEELLEIPYVGEYTANAVLSLSYGVPAAMVDSNIQRIITRLFLKHLLTKPSSRILQKIAELLAPSEKNQEYNYALLDLGALVCRYGIPKCKLCPINGHCDYYSSGKPNVSQRTIDSLADL